MRNQNIIKVILLIICFSFSVGCSGGKSPLEPVINPEFNSFKDIPLVELSESNNTADAPGLMGIYEFSLDTNSMIAELTSARMSSIGESYIVNGISYFTIAPCPDCLKVNSLSMTGEGFIQITFGIRHPFKPGEPLKPPTAVNRLDLDIFDVAMVTHPTNKTPQTYNLTEISAYSNVITANAGYTTELANVIGDQAALPFVLVIDDSITGVSTFNKFAMGDESEFDVTFTVTQKTYFTLYLTMGYGASAKKAQRLNPSYFNPEFNRKSAWKVDVTPPNGSNPPVIGNTWNNSDTTTLYPVTVKVYDWQVGANVNPALTNPTDIYAASGVAKVSLEIPGMHDALIESTSPTTGTGIPANPLIYTLSLANENALPEGQYTGIVKVTDERVPGQSVIGGETDTLVTTPDGVTLEWKNIPEFATYQVFTATVTSTATGNLIWAKRAGGSGDDYGYGITTLSDNSTVITGWFAGTSTFGQDEPNQTTLISAGDPEIFIARFYTDGTLAWAKSAGGVATDGGLAITTLSDNSSVVAGHFSGSATFGLGELNETIMISDGNSDIFVARFDLNGMLLWAKRAGGTGADYGRKVTMLSDDSTILTGWFAGTITFGLGEPNETILISAGGDDIFIARYNPNGTLTWAKRAGGTSDNSAYAITTLSDNSTVLTGWFEGTIIFGEGESNETILNSAGLRDIFIARFEP